MAALSNLSDPNHTPRPTRAAIYLRVSSPGQEDNYSLPTQEAACRHYCQQRGYIVTDEHLYSDGAQRSYTLDRPALMAMRDELRAGHVDVIVAYKMDRLSRDQVQQGVLIYEADRHNVRLEFAIEQFDDTPAGRFIRSANGYVAEVERINIRERTQRGRRARASEGKLIAGAFPLYGYSWVDATSADEVQNGAERKGSKQQKVRYIEDPVAAPVVRRIFADVAAGVPLLTLCRQLDTEGVPTPSQHYAALGIYHRRTIAENWSTATVHRMLMNPAYVGEHAAWRWRAEYRRERDQTSGEMREVRATSVRHATDDERIPLPESTCPPLVDRRIADAARDRLRTNAQQAGRRNRDPEATLLRSGFIFCAYCGHALYTHLHHGVWNYFCRDYRRRPDGKRVCDGYQSIYAADMDRIVWDHVTRMLTEPEQMTRLLADWQADHATHERHASANLEAVEGQLRRLEAKVTNLTLAVADAATPDARGALTKALDDLVRQVSHLSTERDRLQGEAHELRDHADQVATLAEWARSAAGRLATFTYQQKRAALHALGVRVTLWKKTHRPRYEITFDFHGLNAGAASVVGSFGSPTT